MCVCVGGVSASGPIRKAGGGGGGGGGAAVRFRPDTKSVAADVLLALFVRCWRFLFRSRK